MAITELTIRLLLLFFPGLVCFLIISALITPKERRPFDVFIFAFIYGMLSYVMYALLVAVFGMRINSEEGLAIPPPPVTFAQCLTDAKVGLDFLEIGRVTLVSMALALALSYAWNHSWLHRFAKRLGVSRRFQEPNVWSFSLNSPQIRWAVVRDVESKLMFAGYIRAFSDEEDVRELLLTDVIVYNEVTAEELYKADHMYLSRDKNNLVVEFPNPL